MPKNDQTSSAAGRSSQSDATSEEAAKKEEAPGTADTAVSHAPKVSGVLSKAMHLVGALLLECKAPSGLCALSTQLPCSSLAFPIVLPTTQPEDETFKAEEAGALQGDTAHDEVALMESPTPSPALHKDVYKETVEGDFGQARQEDLDTYVKRH